MPNNKYFFLFVLFCFGNLLALGQADSFYSFIPAGKFTLGKKNYAGNPSHTVNLPAFYIAKYETTNAQFAAFVQATGYITTAEKYKNGMTFYPGLAEYRWNKDSTAFWRYPNGIKNGGIENKMNHPVVCISYYDVQAYCKWAGVRLPTIDEWEVAARAGTNTTYFWGEDHNQLKAYANIWHGKDHLKADSSDGYMWTSPVGTYKPNPYGLYDIYGNVFEYCTGYPRGARDTVRVAYARGASWWCSLKTCRFFNSYMMGRNSKIASFSNQGFRVVKTSK
jgi:formylglycine-generating enzyme